MISPPDFRGLGVDFRNKVIVVRKIPKRQLTQTTQIHQTPMNLSGLSRNGIDLITSESLGADPFLHHMIKIEEDVGS